MKKVKLTDEQVASLLKKAEQEYWEAYWYMLMCKLHENGDCVNV